jgi:hypothetical protein
MKTLCITTFVFLLLICTKQIYAQDINDLNLLARYTLIETAEDETGNYDDMTLNNCSFHAEDGIYCNGLSNSDTLHSFASTPRIDGIDFSLFAVTLQFRLDALDITNPIILAGGLWRWLGAEVIQDKIAMIYNSTRLMSDHSLEMNRWYNLTIRYSAVDSTARLYLDDEMILSNRYAIVTAANDKEIMAYNGSNGKSFRGFMRNLNVFGPMTSATESRPTNEKQLLCYPTVVSDIINVSIFDSSILPCQMEIYDMSGTSLLQNTIKDQYASALPICLSQLNAGMYLIRFSKDNKVIKTQSIIKCRK